MRPSFESLSISDQIRIRYGIWRSHPRGGGGAVLLLNGRTEFLEKHLETVGELNQRGLDVYSFDWRGQGGSSRLLPNAQKGHVASYEDYVRDLDRFYRVVLRPNTLCRPLILLAHSMGAHIALRFLHRNPSAFGSAVMLSSMIDIHTDPLPYPVARSMARAAKAVGLSNCYCLRSGNAAASPEFKNNRLTADSRRFFATHAAIAAAPELSLGNVTWGWLAATFRSIDTLKRPEYAGRITTPVLMICAGNDSVVSLRAQKAISARLPNCQLRIIPGARHEILKETDAVRALFWHMFDQFVGTGGGDGFPGR